MTGWTGTQRFVIDSTGDAEIKTAAKGLIVKSPDGSKRARIGIDNSGNLLVTAL
jgi:hypothetical protein